MEAPEIRFEDLTRLLNPVLRLEPIESILEAFEDVLKSPLESKADLEGPLRDIARYKGYQVSVRELRRVFDRGYSLELVLKAKKKWWHDIVRDQNDAIVHDLKEICVREIKDLNFSLFRPYGTPAFSRESERLLYYHDSRALNRNWKWAYEISPLLIAPDMHDDRCFVELFFSASCYQRSGNLTVLSPAWRDCIEYHSRGIG